MAPERESYGVFPLSDGVPNLRADKWWHATLNAPTGEYTLKTFYILQDWEYILYKTTKRRVSWQLSVCPNTASVATITTICGNHRHTPFEHLRISREARKSRSDGHRLRVRVYLSEALLQARAGIMKLASEGCIVLGSYCVTHQT